ncbi:MAG: 16S rRNA (guanine(527)-N(7))-methyltransferase RsmG [Chloroflexia bacterium]|nr:16S rRNA (guanine(527)-N(7))-methyltransferase RsmG [Chloroflexia bacterium]
MVDHLPPENSAPPLLAGEAGRLGLSLGEKHLGMFRSYYEQLLDWNSRINLTRIVGWEEVQVQHFLDSLSAVLVLPPTELASASRIVDIGSGAGFPGLPLKIVFPAIQLMLLESTGKKADFLRHLVQHLGLGGVTVLQARAEEAGRDPVHRERYDLALARAVADLAVLLEYALPLLRVGGLFVAHKGQRVEEEVAAAEAALQLLGGRLRTLRAVELPGLDFPRHLVLVEKVAPTAERYPRRPGLPARRPLS